LRLCSRAPRMAITRASGARRRLSNTSFIGSQVGHHPLAARRDSGVAAQSTGT
jgi:hypothetical protein